MKNFRVDAIVRCRCETCKGKGIRQYEDAEAREENSVCEGVEFSDTFSAIDARTALELADAKFVMICDDLREEFEADGHDIFVEINGCVEVYG